VPDGRIGQKQVCERLVQECTQLHPPGARRNLAGQRKRSVRTPSLIRSARPVALAGTGKLGFNTPPFFILDHESLLRFGATAASEEPGGDHTIKIRTTTRRGEGLKEALRLGLVGSASPNNPPPACSPGLSPAPPNANASTSTNKSGCQKAAALKLDPSLVGQQGEASQARADWSAAMRH